MDPRINKNIDRLQIRPQSANFFDLNTDQKRMFDVQQSQPFNTKSGSNIKVYPEFDNFEHDAFYREDVTKGTMDDFYSPSINKQINPSDFSISKGPTNNFNISKGLSHDFYSLNNKQNNLSDFSRSVSQPSLNLNDFDFLKERMEARVKEEEEKKNVASKKSMSQREQFELFRKY
ncbi:hypothetical protein NAPIS_ORF01787 [Vairimorpha apis BRL 01]|uniref:Uncharacterized protein n=1 Tax=Vairimorpha apis BRL 01 TaxID=1037528 RepID=T0MI38_9MICR|nr:hypothetical protein NAPIS_ORF01787 [Vairimorpha apis BRL 01]